MTRSTDIYNRGYRLNNTEEWSVESLSEEALDNAEDYEWHFFLDRDTIHKEIKEAIDNLPPMQKAVVVAKSYDNATFRQIATRLGISSTHSHRLYKRGLRAIKKHLQSLDGTQCK